MRYAQRAKEIIQIEIDGLQKVQNSLGLEFGRAVELLLTHLKNGGKIVVTGVGKNLPIGQKIAATLTSTGSPAVVIHPQEAMHGDLGLLSSRDILLALSFSGETEELINLISIVKRQGIKIISITGQTNNMLASHSDVVILVPIEREACPFNMAPTTSTTATLVIGDALAMVLLEAQGFNRDDFARLHPGGSIGRSLLLRAADIMRKGDRLAKVNRGAKVKDAILAMTSARAGSVAVVDEQDKVVGIFTDGDLRRHVATKANISDVRVDEIMTPGPITMRGDHLAVEVLALYEKHNIDDLIIVDEEGKIIGMVDIQDLPKMKIL